MIIDMHAHTSKHKMHGLHTQDAGLPQIEWEAKTWGVSHVALMATYFPFKGKGLHNRELLSRIEDRRLFVAFLSLDMSEDVDAGIREIEILSASDQVVGIKLYPGYQDFDPSGADAFKVYKVAAAHRLPVVFHGGELHHCCPKERRQNPPFRCGYNTCPLDKLAHLSNPASFEGAVRMFREVNFVVSHLANPYFEELRDLMWRNINVYTDISGQFVSGSDEDTPQYRQELGDEIEQFIRVPFGIRRLLFGSDFPIQSYSDSFSLLKSLRLEPQEEELVLWQNATDLIDLRGVNRIWRSKKSW